MVADLERLKDLRMLAVEIAAARKIGRKLQHILWKDMQTCEVTGFEFVIALLLFLRAERTFSSIRTLARMHRVDDAMSLVRVMVEKVINAEYIFLTGTDTALDYIQYLSFRRWRDFKDLKSISPELAPKYTEDVQKMFKKAHDDASLKILSDGSTKSRFGRGSDWTDIGLPKRAELIDEAIKKRFSMRDFRSTRILYQTAYKKSAGYLHGTFISVARSLESEERDNIVDQNGLTEMTLSVRIKDENPAVASNAVNLANLVAVSIILFAGKIFKRSDYLDWVTSFKESYKKDLRTAKEIF
jgi:hypothetical protein